MAKVYYDADADLSLIRGARWRCSDTDRRGMRTR